MRLISEVQEITTIYSNVALNFPRFHVCVSTLKKVGIVWGGGGPPDFMNCKTPATRTN